MFFGAVPFARAANEIFINTEPQSGVKITLSTCFKYFPPAGYAPVSVKIENHSGGSGVWDFAFQSPAYNYRSNSFSYRAALGAENNSARIYELLVPLATLDSSATRFYGSISESLFVTVRGPGSREGQTGFPTASRNGKARTEFIGMSSAMVARSWGVLEKELDSRSHQLDGSEVDTTQLPDDWRALAGCARFWITTGEWAKLSAAQKIAVRDWVAEGGVLTIYFPGDPPVGALAEFGGTPSQSQVAHGFGWIKTAVWDGHELDAGLAAKAALESSESFASRLGAGYSSNWSAREIVGTPKLNVPLLIGFMALFAVIVGPMNLFVFTKSGQRHRLFWTTPLISVAASLLLLGVIVLQDGFGGAGWRLVLVHLLPDERKAILQQEQISRTGVLLRQDFQITDPVLLAPVGSNAASTSASIARQYEQSGARFGGDWFASRAVQAQVAETVLPTRAEIQLLNAGEARAGTAAPVIVSSIGATLRELHFVDANGKSWRGENIHVGEKAALRADAPLSMNTLDALAPDAGSVLRESLVHTVLQREFFWAASDDVTGAAIATLPSIRWTQQKAIYTGPVSAAEQGK